MAAHLTPGHTENFIPSFSFMEQNMEIVNQFPSDSEISQMNFQGFLGFSLDSFLVPVPEFPGNLADTFPDFFCQENKPVLPLPESEPVTSDEKETLRGKKRKSVETPESSSTNSSSQTPGNVIGRKNGSGRGKRVKGNEKKDEKKNEVIHVRAKRGQATDSHSLAERLRREKINERLKCLQSIVPGCYKSMGMAVMLDEIINYVQSLQNQVEFLSMKLTAASAIHEFNTETDIMETMQRAEMYEAMKMQKVVREGWEGLVPTQIGQKDINFGCYSLPYHK